MNHISLKICLQFKYKCLQEESSIKMIELKYLYQISINCHEAENTTVPLITRIHERKEATIQIIHFTEGLTQILTIYF